MQLTNEQLRIAARQRELVTAAVLQSVADVPKGFTDPAQLALAAGSVLDGMLAAMAWVAAGSGQYQGMRERRLLADNVRSGLIKFMNLAERDAEKGIDWERGAELPN